MTGADDGALPAGDFERLLAECIALLSERGEAALDAALAARPAEAARIRQRLRELERLGLLQREEPEPAFVGGHRIVKRLGRGGMGTVYLAEEPVAGRRVALKLASLPVGAGDDDGADGRRRARARFAREVAVMAQLCHPNLVAIRASGEHEGRPWFSMDHVAGVPLSRVVARLRARGTPPEALTGRDARSALQEELELDGGLPATPAEEPTSGGESRWSGDYVSWCARLALDVAGALEHAHAHGVLHRDVKPSNVLVRADGSGQLFDFGLAQVDDQGALTRSGDIAGTPYALAPEQIDARCGAVDGRTDVWGLGVTLYEMLALRRPFDAAGTAALLQRILDSDPVPLRRLHAGAPVALQHVCATALEKPQRRRHADMAALRADLESLVAGRAVRARGAGWPRRLQRYVTRQPARAAALGLAALVAVAVPVVLLAVNAAVRGEARRAELAAQEAQRQAAANAEVVAYLVGLFRPFEPDDTALAAGTLAMVESQAQELESRFANQPLVRAALLEATGTVYANLGEPARALPLYDRALAIRQSEQGESDPETARLLEALARVHLDTGDPASARDLCRRVLAALAPAGDAGAPLAARARTTLARAQAQLGALAEAAAELERALAALAALPVRDDGALAEAHEAAADVAMQRGARAEVLLHGEQALAAQLAEWFPDRRALVRLLQRLQTWRAEAGDERGALAAAAAVGKLRDAERAGAGAPVPEELRLRTPQRARYEEAFQAGITALQARRLDEAQARFAECAALRPGAGVCAYNEACAHALAGRVAEALACLERSEQLGYGLAAGYDELIRADVDLAALRAEPRFDAVVRRLRENGARLRDWSAQPRVCLPPESEGAGPLPLLVVLHADGATPDAVLAGPWRAVAAELGAALLAPAARTPLGPTPEAGLAWLDDVERFARQPWGATDGALAELRAFCAEHDVDRSRVYLAGEGSGAVLALDLALRAPGLVRGVLLVQGPALVEGQATRALTAAALGVRVGGFLDPAQPLPWVEAGVPAYAERLQAWLAATGLANAGALRVEALPATAAARAESLAEALRALLPDAPVWSEAPPLRHARSAHAVVATATEMWALAGTGADGAPVLEVERFDEATAAWIDGTLLPNAGLNAPAAVALDGRLLLIGGFDTTTNVPTAEVLVYDPAARAWSAGPPLPAPRGGHAAVVLDGKVHVLGGGNSERTLADHSVLDPVTQAWSAAAPLPRAKGSPAAVVLDGRLLVLGGRSGGEDFGDVDVYDAATDTWSPGPALPPRGTAGAAVLLGTLFVFGGESQARGACLDEVLGLVVQGDDLAHGTWHLAPPLPTPRSFARAVVLGESVYVVGGSSGPAGRHDTRGLAVVERYGPAP